MRDLGWRKDAAERISSTRGKYEAGKKEPRVGGRGKMPRKSTGLTDRLTLPMRPELLREIDQVRGDVPRVAWIRRELAVAVMRHRPRRRKRDGKSK